MAPKWEGLFEIEEVLGPVTYQLKLPATWRIHNVFHAILLKPYQRGIWRKFCHTTPRHCRWRRSLSSWNDPETQKKGMRIPIPHQMGRISNHWGLVGTQISFLWRWWSVGQLQTTTSTMKKSCIKRLLAQPRAKFTLKLPIIPEEGSDKNFLIKQLKATEWLIEKMLYNYWKTPFIYPTYTSFLDYFLQL